MKDATRTRGFARQTNGTLLNLVCGALLAGGLMATGNHIPKHLEPGSISDAAASIGTPSTAHNWFTSAIFEVLNISSAPKPEQSEEQPAANADDGDLSARMVRVRDWVASRYRVSTTALESALVAAEEEGRAKGIDPLLIVAVMAVESSFNPRAVSNMGAQGLMQVIPRFHMDKMDGKRSRHALFDPDLNVRVGTRVLSEGLTRYGSLQNALQYYNGSLGDRSLRYTRKVMALKRRLVAVATG